MTDIAIRAEGLGKRYRLGQGGEAYGRITEVLSNKLRAPFRRSEPSHVEDFWALRDVAFEVPVGAAMGIIGRNGAGKSTLLKILSRITWPTTGSATLYGRIASLLEVGTGFHPELSGEENVYLSGAVLGMKHAEIKRNFDEIVDFSGIDPKFLDTPVKRYSSGMYLRLAFAVAAHLEPEILVVDEVLAVGDVAFQRRCLTRIGEVSREGRTVLFVSHNLPAVEHLSRRGMLFERGRLVFQGTVRDTIERYIRSATSGPHDAPSHVVDLGARLTRRPDAPAWLRRLELFTADGKPLEGGLAMGAPFEARVGLVLERPTVGLELVIRFDTMLGQRILVADSAFDPAFACDERSGAQTVICRIPSLTLMPGDYRLRVGLYLGGVEVDAVDDATRISVVPSDYYGSGRLPRSGTFVLPQRWRLS